MVPKTLAIEEHIIYNVVNCGEKWSKVERRKSFRRSACLSEVEQVFLGRYDHTIDEKGRMTIPARFRELLGSDGEAFISLGFDQNLIVWPAPAFAALTDHLGTMSVADPSARLLRRIFLSNAFQVEFDKAGRILLPQPLRASAHLENSAVVAGVGETFEIWSPAQWQKQDTLIEEARENSEQFAELNLPLH